MLSKYAANPYAALLLVSLNCGQTFLWQHKARACTNFMGGLRYLFSFQKESRRITGEQKREVARFELVLRLFFFGLCQRGNALK